MKNRRILISLLVIALVVTVASMATWAEFSDISRGEVAITAATIKIGGVEGLPIPIQNALPGETFRKDVAITNGGSRPMDLYVHLAERRGFDFDPVLSLTIKGQGANWDGRFGQLGWVKVAEDLQPGDSVKLNMSVTLDRAADNRYQGQEATYVLEFYAVQFDGAAPQP